MSEAQEPSKTDEGQSRLSVGLGVTASEKVELDRQHLELLKRDAFSKLLAAEKAWYAYFCEAPLGHERERAAYIYKNVRCATRLY